MDMKLKAFLGALSVVFVFWLGRCTGPEPTTTVVEGKADTVQVESATLLALVEELKIENKGLKAKLEGVRELEPTRVIVTDTILAECPAVTYDVGRVFEDGRWRFSRLTRVDSGYQPNVLDFVPETNCDEGLSFGPEGIICDPALLGHFSFYVAPVLYYTFDPAHPISFGAEGGLSWTPSYRSPHSADLFVTAERGGALGLRGTFGWSP